MVLGPSLPLVRGRVHSIFVLRLFNDGVAMWLLYAAVYLFLLNRCHTAVLTRSTCVARAAFFYAQCFEPVSFTFAGRASLRT